MTSPEIDPDSRPRLLPNASVAGRNAIVYAVSALIAAQISCGLYLLAPETGIASFGMLVAGLCGLPLLAYGLGYATIATYGKPRRPAPGPPQRWDAPRLGAAIAIGGTWLAWAGLLLIAGLL